MGNAQRRKDKSKSNGEKADKNKSEAIKDSIKSEEETGKTASIEINIDTTKVYEQYNVFIAALATRNGQTVRLSDMNGTFTPIALIDNTVPWPKESNYCLPLIENDTHIHSLTITNSTTAALVSGRIYVIYTAKKDPNKHPLLFSVIESAAKVISLQYPSPTNATGVPGYNALFDKMEFTFDDTNTWWCNLTQVDFFCLPITIQLHDSKVLGIGDNQRQAIFDEFVALKDFSPKLVQRAQSDGDDDEKAQSQDGIIRVLSPNTYFSPGPMQKIDTFWDKYVAELWKSDQIISIEASENVTGQINDDKLEFKDQNGNIVSRITAPSSTEVWGCNGIFLKVSKLDGEIKTAVAAAINRGVALGYNSIEKGGNSGNVQYWNDSTKFYVTKGVENHYAYIMHKYNINNGDKSIAQDGGSYAFPYDDYPKP